MLAMLVTAVGVRTLLADISLRAPAPNRPAVIYIEGPLVARVPDPEPVLPAPITLPAPDASRIEAARRLPARVDRPAAPGRVAVPAPAREPVVGIVAPSNDAAPAPPPADDRRALDLSPDVMRAAARDSRSSVRRSADASGRPLDNEPRSQADAIASSVARAGKPDCISPNEGGSLLSVFTLAYAAMRDQCR